MCLAVAAIVAALGPGPSARAAAPADVPFNEPPAQIEAPIPEPADPLPREEINSWMKSFLEEARDRQQFVGAGVSVFRASGPVLERAYGEGNRETAEAFHPEVTYVPLADYGNRFLLKALYDLEQQDRLSLSQPAELFLTRIILPPEQRHLTLENLFTAHSGLTASIRGTEETRHKSRSSDLTHIRRMLKHSAKEAPSFPARSSLASALAAIALEDVTGRSLEEGLSKTLTSEGMKDAFLNTPQSDVPRFISRQHEISRYGEVELRPLLASASGFLATNGIYLTLSELTTVLAKDLAGLEAQAPFQKRLAGTLFNREFITIADKSYLIYRHQTSLDLGTLDIRLIPELDIGIVAYVNSGAKPADMAPAKGRLPIDAPLSASDIVNNLIFSLLVKPGDQEDRPRLTVGDLTGSYVRASQPLLGPDRLLEALSTKVRVRVGQTASNGRALIVDGDGPFILEPQTGSAFLNAENGRIIDFETLATTNGPVMRLAGETLERSEGPALSPLAIIFWSSIVLQFAIIASLRWPVHVAGARIAKSTGLASVFLMTAAFLMPAVLTYLGHSRTLVDGPYLLSAWAFPIASVLAIATALLSLVAWRRGYWADEGFGFTRRLCFTVGTFGLLGLTLCAYQWGLTTFPLS